MDKDGPIIKLLESGIHWGDPGKLGNARGAAFELETAFDLLKSGEIIVSFGNKLDLIGTANQVIKKLDVDIEITTKLIECKNWDWSNLQPNRLAELQRKLPLLRDLGRSKGKIFEVHFKNAVPDFLKDWLIKNKINYIQGK